MKKFVPVPSKCTQYFTKSDGIYQSLNWGTNLNNGKKWKYSSCFENECILRFLQLHKSDFRMQKSSKNGSDKCDENNIKFKDEKQLVSTESSP